MGPLVDLQGGIKRNIISSICLRLPLFLIWEVGGTQLESAEDDGWEIKNSTSMETSVK